MLLIVQRAAAQIPASGSHSYLCKDRLHDWPIVPRPVGQILNGSSGKLDSPFLPQAVAETEAIGHDYPRESSPRFLVPADLSAVPNIGLSPLFLVFLF